MEEEIDMIELVKVRDINLKNFRNLIWIRIFLNYRIIF